MTLQVITTSEIIRKNGPNRPYPLITRYDTNAVPPGLTVGVLVGDTVHTRIDANTWHESTLEAQYRPITKPGYWNLTFGSRPRYLRWFTESAPDINGFRALGSIGWTTTTNTTTTTSPVIYANSNTQVTSAQGELSIFSTGNSPGWVRGSIYRVGGPVFGTSANVGILGDRERRVLSQYGSELFSSAGSELRALNLLDGGRTRITGNSNNLALDRAATPALGDMVTNGNSTSANRIFYVGYTHESGTGIKVYARSWNIGGGTTDYGIIGWPSGRSLTGLGTILLGWMPSNYLVVLAVWTSAGRTIGYATKLETNGTWTNWSEVWDESVNADLQYVAFDQFPHDNSLRMAASSFAPTSTTWLFEADASNLGAPPPIPNVAPNAPVVTAPARVRIGLPITLAWTFSDPDVGDTQSAYEIRKDPTFGSTTYWTGSPNGFTTTSGASSKIAGSAMTATIENATTASFVGAEADYAVRTWDNHDAVSGWSTDITITRTSNPPSASFTAPASGVTFAANTISFTWTLDLTQAGYQIRVFNGTTTSGTAIANTGQIETTTTAGHVLTVPGEGQKTAELTVYTSDGIASIPDTVTFTITLPEPETNTIPNTPTPTTASGNLPIDQSMTLAWTFSDPDVGDTQSAYEVRRTFEGQQSYWIGTVGGWSSSSNTQTKRTGSVTSATVQNAVTHTNIGEVTDLQVRTWDQGDLVSGWSSAVRYTRTGIPLTANFLTPTAGTTADTHTINFSWTPRAGQSAYRIRVFNGTTTMGSSVALDTGQTTSAASSAQLTVPGEGQKTAELTLFTSDGVASNPTSTVTFTIDTPDPVPDDNVAPNAPTNLTGGEFYLIEAATVGWTFSDDNTNDIQGWYEIRERRGNAFRYWLGTPGDFAQSSSSSTKLAGTANMATIYPANDTEHDPVTLQVSVRTWDNHDTVGPWSSNVQVRLREDPTITATINHPNDNQGVTGNSVIVSWIAQPFQVSAQIRVFNGASTSGTAIVNTTNSLTPTDTNITVNIPGLGQKTIELTLFTATAAINSTDTVTFNILAALANLAPTAPTILSQGGDLPLSEQMTLQWQFNDPNTNDTQSAYEIRRTRDEVISYWTGIIDGWSSVSSSGTMQTGLATLATIESAQAISQVGTRTNLAVRTWDSHGEVSPYSNQIIYTRTGTAPEATITSPTTDEELDAGNITVRWTPHAAQAAYRVRVFNGSAVTSTAEVDTGQVNSANSFVTVTVTGTGPRTVELVLYTSDNVASNPDTVTFTLLPAGPPPPAVNVAPTAPTITTQGGNLPINQNMTLAWQFNDPNPSDTQSAFEIRRMRDGQVRYWRSTGRWRQTQAATTKIISSDMTAIIEEAVDEVDIGEVTDLAVRTWDQNDVPGPFSSEITWTRTSMGLIADFTAPNPGDTLNDQTVAFAWITQNGQASYRLRVYSGSGTLGTVLIDTGQVISTANNRTVTIPGEGIRTGRLEVYTADNVASNSDTVTFTVDLPSVGSSSFRIASDYASNLPNGRFNYWSPNPVVASSVDIYRRIAGETDRGIRVGKDLPIPSNWTTGQNWTDYTMGHQINYEYQVVLKTATSETAGNWTRISNL